MRGVPATVRIANAMALNRLVREQQWLAEIYEAAARDDDRSTPDSKIEFASFTTVGGAWTVCMPLARHARCTPARPR